MSSENASTSALPQPRRDIEYLPLEHKGQSLIVIRDHLGLVPQGQAITRVAFHLLALLEQCGSWSEFQSGLIRMNQGAMISRTEAQKLVDSLDQLYLLQTQRFFEARQEIVERFTAQTYRDCLLAGQSYPESPQALDSWLREIIAAAPEANTETAGSALGLMAPHIDLSLGKRSYGRAYRLLEHVEPDLVVILGVGHHLGLCPYSISSKAYRTPLGDLHADREAVEELRFAGGTAVAEDDFVHRSEHSIEFQALFLRQGLSHIEPRIIPVLCGSLSACLPEYSREAFLNTAGDFLEGLRRRLSSSGGRTLVVAGVDLSHIGPKFGHDQPARALQGEAEAHDRALLRCLESLDAEALWQESRRVRDGYNVCGFSALATLVEILPQCKGQILDYEMNHQSGAESAVSFAAAAFTAGR